MTKDIIGFPRFSLIQDQPLLSSRQSESNKDDEVEQIEYKNQGTNSGRTIKITPFQLYHMQAESNPYGHPIQYGLSRKSVSVLYASSKKTQSQLNKSKEDLPYFNTQCFFNKKNLDKKVKLKVLKVSSNKMNSSINTFSNSNSNRNRRTSVMDNNEIPYSTLTLIKQDKSSYLEDVNTMKRYTTVKKFYSSKELCKLSKE